MNANTKTSKPFAPGLFDPGTSDLEPHLLGNRCHGCGEVFFPRKTAGICTRCQGGDLEEIELGGQGKISSFTVAFQAPAGGFYKGPVPYAYGTVDLPEGVRVLTQFAEPFDQLEMGGEARIVVETLFVDAEENEWLTYRFKPAQKLEGTPR